MAQIPQQPEVKLTSTKDYRDNYANSVQVRVNVWDFFLVFGTLKQQTPAEVEVENFQGVYLSPQQAKALLSILGQNVAQYEQAFGDGPALRHAVDLRVWIARGVPARECRFKSHDRGGFGALHCNLSGLVCAELSCARGLCSCGVRHVGGVGVPAATADRDGAVLH